MVSVPKENPNSKLLGGTNPTENPTQLGPRATPRATLATPDCTCVLLSVYTPLTPGPPPPPPPFGAIISLALTSSGAMISVVPTQLRAMVPDRLLATPKSISFTCSVPNDGSKRQFHERSNALAHVDRCLEHGTLIKSLETFSLSQTGLGEHSIQVF